MSQGAQPIDLIRRPRVNRTRTPPIRRSSASATSRWPACASCCRTARRHHRPADGHRARRWRSTGSVVPRLGGRPPAGLGRRRGPNSAEPASDRCRRSAAAPAGWRPSTNGGGAWAATATASSLAELASRSGRRTARHGRSCTGMTATQLPGCGAHRGVPTTPWSDFTSAAPEPDRRVLDNVAR